MRAFFAVEVEPAPDPAAVRGPAPRHLTLRFLGEVDDPVVTELRRRLGPALVGRAPFEFELEGVGAFPSRDHPRVVWQGVGRGREELSDLARAVRAEVVSAGLPDDPAPFVAHVTLFRVRSRRDHERAIALLASGVPIVPTRVVRVEVVHLKESARTREGVVHRTVASFPLAGVRP
ncbi:MAG: RNA 2',3'-cyclic phosphodiesterase [Thermoplasmata archaeon]|nr:RNA 2',3'-cyclic phosphodiesterase [Thermoplasmata archaeon]